MKRAMVTGASSGIGREFALQLAREGYALTCVARRENRLQALVEELPGTGHRYLVADLGSEAGLAGVLAALGAERHHLMVNNAGYSVLKPFQESTLEQQQAMLAVNCGALTAIAHAFLQQAEKGDAMINLASIVAFLPTPAQPMYSASKAFIASLSECLWEEQRHRGVYVMGLCPGITETEFIHTATGGEADGDNLPAAMSQTATEVVDEALAALRKRRRAIVVPGRVNRLMMQMPRFLSRQRLLRTLAVVGDPEKSL